MGAQSEQKKDDPEDDIISLPGVEEKEVEEAESEKKGNERFQLGTDSMKIVEMKGEETFVHVKDSEPSLSNARFIVINFIEEQEQSDLSVRAPKGHQDTNPSARRPPQVPTPLSLPLSFRNC